MVVFCIKPMYLKYFKTPLTFQSVISRMFPIFIAIANQFLLKSPDSPFVIVDIMAIPEAAIWRC